MLPFKYPRTSQPQGAVEIDWSNPLARGLVFAHIPTRSGATINGSGLGRIAPDVGGIAASTDYSPGAGNQDITWPISTVVLASARTFVVLSANDGAVDGFDTNSVEGDGPDGYSFDRLAIGASSFFPTMDRNYGSGISITSSAQPRIFAGRVIGGQQNVWHNGVSSSNSVTGTRRITPAQLRVGRNGSDTTVTTTCYLSLYWARYLSDAELSLLSKAPWQLFRPQARSLWMPGTVSGGSSHALTGSNSTQSSTSGTGGITQAHLLTGASCSQPATSGTGAITQGATHILTGANSTQAATSGTGAITQRHLLTGAGSSQTAASGTGAIIAGAVHVLAAANASQSATSSAAAITQGHVLISAPSVQDSIASASAIVQRHMLMASACSQAAVSGVGAITSTAPGVAVYPLASQVLAGVQYGPTGADYTGTLTGGSGPSAADIASAVIAAAQVTPIWADARRMNGALVQGDGSDGNLWRGASV